MVVKIIFILFFYKDQSFSDSAFEFTFAQGQNMDYEALLSHVICWLKTTSTQWR